MIRYFYSHRIADVKLGRVAPWVSTHYAAATLSRSIVWNDLSVFCPRPVFAGCEPLAVRTMTVSLAFSCRANRRAETSLLSVRQFRPDSSLFHAMQRAKGRSRARVFGRTANVWVVPALNGETYSSPRFRPISLAELSLRFGLNCGGSGAVYGQKADSLTASSAKSRRLHVSSLVTFQLSPTLGRPEPKARWVTDLRLLERGEMLRNWLAGVHA
jgi:hypothetical protein